MMTDKMKCIIVDDDLMARKSLERLCKKVDFLEVIHICENGKEALDALVEHEPDLIFLDMEMPELTGLEFLDAAVVLPQVIFFTSKKEYAYSAFEYQVTDFLKKPTTFPRFQQAANKAYEIFKKETVANNPTPTPQQSQGFYIREDGKLCRIEPADILYFENVGDYIRLATSNGNHIFHGTLKSILAKIDSSQFIKVHRSYIVNLNKIKDIEENSLVVGKKVIPISRANKPILMKQLNLL